jgi:hypothetical protein
VVGGWWFVLVGPEPQATADLKSEIVAEEGLVLHGAVCVDYWAWILQGPITRIDTHERVPARLKFNTATDVERERGVTGGKLTRGRRREDRDAGKRIGAPTSVLSNSLDMAVARWTPT